MADFTIHEDFPKSEIEFDQRFSRVDACYEYLAKARWSDGFVCEKCGNDSCWISAKYIANWLEFTLISISLACLMQQAGDIVSSIYNLNFSNL